MKTAQKLSQLLQTDEIANWQLAWELVQGNPALLPVFEEKFIKKLEFYGANLCYEMAETNPLIQSLLCKSICQFITNIEWERKKYTSSYETMVLCNDQQGILLFYYLDNPDSTHKFVFSGYETFNYEVYYHQTQKSPYLKIIPQISTLYIPSENQPKLFSHFVTQYDEKVEVQMVGNITAIPSLTLFHFLKEDLYTFEFIEQTSKQTIQEWIPNFAAWKKSL